MNYTIIDIKRKVVMMSGVFESFEDFLECSNSYRNKNTFVIEGLVITNAKGILGVECYGVDFIFKNRKEFSNDQIDTLYLLRNQSGYSAPMC